MSLFAALERARTEEDVKDAYIKALGLKAYSKNLVDIQTQEVWFEAKAVSTPSMVMFAQLLFYIRAAKKRGEAIPAFLAVIDRDKAALMPTERALPLLDDKSIVWPKSGSQAGKELAAQVAPYVQTHIVEYEIAHDEVAFVTAVRDAIRERRIIRTPITPDNLRQVFDRWVAMIGSELGTVNPADYAVLFFADIMHDGASAAMQGLSVRLLFDGGKPVFYHKERNETYELASERGYRNFWAIYHRPPDQKHRHYLLERRDSLLPVDEQKFKGAYYTPLHIVDRAYDQLVATLGPNWQDRYLVWDMCAGVGNLEAKHSNLRNVFMSTLDQADVTIMKSNPAFAGAEIFQYDYLNDDVTDFGGIDYSLSNKVPLALRQAIADARKGFEGVKPILVLINPPYAEATNNDNVSIGPGAKNKSGVAKTRFAATCMEGYGRSSNELFTQFMARIAREMPNSMLAMFSKLKYVNAPNFQEFRHKWRAEYQSGFVVPSRVFDGLKGAFPIGFLIWLQNEDQAIIDEITVDVLDRDGRLVGDKSVRNVLNSKLLNVWLARPKANKSLSVPLKNALAVTPGRAWVSTWSDNAAAYMYCGVNDIQHAGQQTVIFSSQYGGGHGFYITAENVWQAAVVFSVRRLIAPTWLNDRDQFLQPSQPLTDDFKSDCLVWMLFNGSNLTAGADGLRWNDRDWSLKNHFIPFTETEVGASGRFESDFMVRHMAGMTFTSEAQAVLDAGRVLWRRFHATQFPRKVRDEYKLGRPDAGWYQIRNALAAYGDTELTDFDPFKTAYAALGAKLRPLVYELGFLPQ